jgi:Protein of unknown function (DUF2752)
VDENSMSTKLIDNGALRRGAIVLGLAGVFALIVAFRVPVCPMAGVLGIPCPGCGLTRATLALFRGDVRGALALHPLAPVIAPLFIAAVASAALGYVRGPQRRAAHGETARPWLASRTATVLATALLLATLGVWGARFFGYFGGPAPVTTFHAWTRSVRAPPITARTP